MNFWSSQGKFVSSRGDVVDVFEDRTDAVVADIASLVIILSGQEVTEFEAPMTSRRCLLAVERMPSFTGTVRTCSTQGH